MKQPKKVLVFLAAVALLFLVALWWRHAPSSSRPESRGGGESRAPRGPESSPAPSAGPADASPNLTGFVIEDLSGQRVPGILVEAFGPPAAGESNEPLAVVRSGSGGDYALRLRPGPCELRWFEETDSTAARRSCLGSKHVEILPDRSLRVDLHFERFPSVVVEGRVIDAKTSLPLPRAQPLIHRDVKDWDKRFDENLRTPNSTLKNRFTDFLGVENLLTGEDGTFRVSARLVPGKYLASVSAIEGYKPYFGDRQGTGFTVVAGVTEQRYFVDLRMTPEPRTCVTGRVLTRSGEPVPNARLGLRNGIRLAETWTDQEGRYTFWASADPVSVDIRHARYRTLHYELGPIPPSDAPKEDAPRILDPKPLQVSISAVDESGAPVALDRLWVAENKLGAANPVNPLFEVATSAAGKSQFSAEPGLAYSFLLPPGAPWKISSIEAGEGAPTSAGIHFTFQSPESGIKIRLVPRRQ